METTLNVVSIIIIVFGILQIILFFKIWGMTNNVREIKNMMELKIKNEFQEKENIAKSPIDDNIEYNKENIEYDKEDFPANTKFNKGDIVLYLPEKTKLIVIGYMSPNIFKCKTIDGTDKIYCFQEEYLNKV